MTIGSGPHRLRAGRLFSSIGLQQAQWALSKAYYLAGWAHFMSTGPVKKWALTLQLIIGPPMGRLGPLLGPTRGAVDGPSTGPS